MARIIDDSVITCDEIIDAGKAKTVTTNFNKKNATCQTKNIYILFAFLLISIALLMAVSMYYNLIKYWVKQKHL